MEGKEDAMKKRICVTEKDIQKGEAACCNRCPVALALHRELGAEYFVGLLIGSGWVAFVADRGEDSLRLPVSCGDFAFRFDCGLAVEPFEFELDVPEAT